MSFARGSTLQVIPPQEMARVKLYETIHPRPTNNHKKSAKHRSSQEDQPRPTPKSSKEERQSTRQKGERKRGEKSQQKRPREARHETKTEQRITVNSLSDSLESVPSHKVFAHGSQTFQVRSCQHSTLHSKVLKKHSVDTSTQRGSTRTTRRNT
jgi:hypothetical protein